MKKQITHTAANYREIERAKAFLESHGYQVHPHENGHLIVQDPVMQCGYGSQASQLLPAGFQPVAVRSYTDAVCFVSARS
jgi:hypothetical protein